MIYETTTRAEDDLIEIYELGFRKFGRAKAEGYHEDLVACFELLAANPLIARERTELTPPVRLHFHASHVVVYTVTSDHVLIVRVLHGRQDWERHLGP